MAISISVLILAIGLISLFTLPVEQYPDIAPPTVYVTASYTGADAEAVMNSVIMPLEEKVGVSTMKRQTSFLQIGALVCTDGRYDQTFLANYLDINVIPQIKRIEGVGDVMELGDTYSMRIWLKPERMAQY